MPILERRTGPAQWSGSAPKPKRVGVTNVCIARPCPYAAAVIALTFSGAKNSAGDIVPAFIRAKSSMAFWLP